MANPDQIWLEASRALERGTPFALATVVNVRGSTPREIGAKMLVHATGQVGTIGGGCGEAEIFRKAQLLLAGGSDAGLAEVDLTGDFDQDEVGTCGGIMEVFIDLWRPQRDLPAARQLADAVRASRPMALVTLIEPGAEGEAHPGERAVMQLNEADPGELPVALNADGRRLLAQHVASSEPALLRVGVAGEVEPTARVSRDTAVLFLDPLQSAQRLIIIGAGHIAQPLCAIGAMLGFHVIVIDDRASFASRERFPAAAEVLVQPFAAAIDSLHLDVNSYVVVVTRGHAFDESAVRAALKQQPGYIGMIGSMRRVRATLARLEADGVSAATLTQVHAPIGLDIGAETPEEIAVAIMGEIVRERRYRTRDEFNLGVKLGRLARQS